jgi:hypothetical protein
VSNTFVGMPGFPEAAKVAVADTQLRRNLAHATSVIRAKRNLVVGELVDWQELRLAGAAIKDRVLRHLDRYLETFEAAATAAGAQVHWARDGDEAARLCRAGATGRRRRGRQGQVDGHPGDGHERSPRRASPRWRPTWPQKLSTKPRFCRTRFPPPTRPV